MRNRICKPVRSFNNSTIEKHQVYCEENGLEYYKVRRHAMTKKVSVYEAAYQLYISTQEK